MDRSLRVRFDHFELDEADARLTRAGQPVRLAPKPFAVLCVLARTPRTLLTKNALLDSVWGHRFVTESVLKSAVSELRAALDDDDPKAPRYIETVSRRGYRFVGAPSGSATCGGMQPAPPLMVGRSAELERLTTAWQRARAGRPQVIWIAGEAGMGKTTLIERFMAEVGEAHCAHGQCVEQHGAAEPHLPVLEALAGLCRRDAALPDLIRALAPTWLGQLPWLCGGEGEASSRELAHAGGAPMLYEMGLLLERYTQHRPLVLVTEDLQWSDQATVRLIDYVARRCSSARLLWLASFRTSEVLASEHALGGLCQSIRLHRLAEEVQLDVFSPIEVAQYLAVRIPALASDHPFVRALHERTDGLPWFVAHVEKHLLSRCDGGSAARLRLASMPLPEHLTGLVERYIRELAPDQRAALEAATSCGVAFRPRAVARVLKRDVASVAQCCAELAGRQRWLRDTDGGYAFRYALYREVLCRGIAPRARKEVERQAERRPHRAHAIAGADLGQTAAGSFSL